MKLLIDNNLSHKLTQPLTRYFERVAHVRELLSANVTDKDIWNYALDHRFHILTKDNDFDDWSILKGCPPKVIHLLCGNQTTLFILNLVVRNKDLIRNFLLDSEPNCLLKIHL